LGLLRVTPLNFRARSLEIQGCPSSGYVFN
jgi:hypothetical protein